MKHLPRPGESMEHISESSYWVYCSPSYWIQTCDYWKWLGTVSAWLPLLSSRTLHLYPSLQLVTSPSYSWPLLCCLCLLHRSSPVLSLRKSHSQDSTHQTIFLHCWAPVSMSCSSVCLLVRDSRHQTPLPFSTLRYSWERTSCLCHLLSRIGHRISRVEIVLTTSSLSLLELEIEEHSSLEWQRCLLRVLSWLGVSVLSPWNRRCWLCCYPHLVPRAMT